jgi:hypothetical protein
MTILMWLAALALITAVGWRERPSIQTVLQDEWDLLLAELEA